MSNIEKVRKIAEEEYEDWGLKYHLPYVVKNSKLLAKKLGADEEIVELAALLHDISIAKSGNEDHEKMSAQEAERILKSVGYPQKVIDRVKHCIESHRASKDVKPETLEAKIVANADAMAHFDNVPALFVMALKNENNDVDKARKWVYDKIERDWNKKLTIPEAKEMMREKYGAIKLLFG